MPHELLKNPVTLSLDFRKNIKKILKHTCIIFPKNAMKLRFDESFTQFFSNGQEICFANQASPVAFILAVPYCQGVG